jgi:hypothetical protein
MLKRKSRRGQNGAESADDNGDVVAERARKQPKLPNPQTHSDGTGATDASLNPQGNYSIEHDLGLADEFVSDSVRDAERGSATHPDFLGTPPTLTASQSDIVDEELPVQGSSTALVYYGMVIPKILTSMHWCWQN